MLTKQQARAAVEAELFALELNKPMSLPEKYAFSESACRRLVFQSETDRLKEIIEWTDAWQALWLPDDRAPSIIGAAEGAVVGKLRFALPRLDWAILASRVAAWRADVGRVFAKRRAALPQNGFDEAMNGLAEVAGEDTWRPRGSRAQSTQAKSTSEAYT